MKKSPEYMCYMQWVRFLNKSDILFIVNFYLGKYCFSLDTFWTHLVI